MEAMVQSGSWLVIIIFGVVALALALQYTKVGKNIGPALCVIILGLILVNTKVVPGWHDVYGVFAAYCIPISMSILMMNVDFAELKKVSKEPLIAMFSAALCVSIAAVICGLIFGTRIDEGWKIAGMYVGTYTGGSANLTAIAYGLNATTETIAAANAADYVVGMPLLMILFALPTVMNKSEKFHKIWPYHLTDEERLGSGGLDSIKPLVAPKEISILDIATLFGLALLINEVCALIANALFDASFANAGKILLISTVSVCLAQIPFIKNLRGKLELGIMTALFYYTIVGFLINIEGFFGSAMLLTIFCFCVILGAIALHLIVMRLLKIKYEYVLVAMTAGIGEGTTAALVASNGGWNSVINIAVILGVIGAVLGNYFGIGVAYLIQALIG